MGEPQTKAASRESLWTLHSSRATLRLRKMWPRVGKTGILPTSVGNPVWLWAVEIAWRCRETTLLAWMVTPPPPTEGFSSNEWGAPSWGFHDRDWRPAWGGQVLLGISEPACRNAYTCLKGTFLETTNFCLSKWRQWASGRQIHRLERPRDFLVILLLLYRL